MVVRQPLVGLLISRHPWTLDPHGAHVCAGLELPGREISTAHKCHAQSIRLDQVSMKSITPMPSWPHWQQCAGWQRHHREMTLVWARRLVPDIGQQWVNGVVGDVLRSIDQDF